MTAFEELRRLRAMTESVVLTQAAGSTFIRAGLALGFSHDECVSMAFKAVALGNKDAGR